MAEPTRKSQIDAILLKLPGVAAKKIGKLDAYLVNDRMFACINGNAIGLRMPAAVARELQFSRADIGAFQPSGLPVSREWIQVEHENAADFEKDLALFQQSLEFVKSQRGR